MTRAYNFCAGPAALPEIVLKQAQNELLDWQGHGTSVMEISHRGAAFEALAAEAENDLRLLLKVPEHYHILFLPAGATVQFSMIPLNLLGTKKKADYVHTGHWSQKAIKEAGRYCDVNVVASSAPDFLTIPNSAEWRLDPSAAYLHYTSNETIAGVEFDQIPPVESVPLVVDMSSNILAEPLDVSRFGLIYASAQKNIGAAGLSIVIVRDDLLHYASPLTPTVFHYKTQAAQHSMANTPPTYNWYLAGLVFKWLLAQGGLSAIAKINQQKAAVLYEAIDKSQLYVNHVDKRYRSKMNVPFYLKRPELLSEFLNQANEARLLYLKGHALVGGVRASIYNAVPLEAVQALIAFMKAFEQRHF